MYKALKIVFLTGSFLFSNILLLAQTSGPATPEVQSFQAASITNMVETSTGEFQYSITLFTIGGYPITVNYNSQVGMENEASMVGLGFNLNCGAITRQVRSLPDDFNGDIITKKLYMKDNKTMGIDLGLSVEFIGKEKKDKKTDKKDTVKRKLPLKLTTTAGLFYNNYNGWGIENHVGAGFHGNKGGLSGDAGIGINSNSQHGTSINPYCGLSVSYYNNALKTYKLNKFIGKKYEIRELKIKARSGGGVGYDFNSISYSPKIEFPFSTFSFDFSLKAGYAFSFFEIGADIRGYSVVQKLQSNILTNNAYGFLYADNGKNNEKALMDFARDNDGIVTETTPNLAFAYATPDVYSVAAHGAGGVFEIKRNNVFVGFDPKSSTNNSDLGIELEAGFGIGAHAGAEIRYGYTLNTAEKWNNNRSNPLLGLLDFNDVTAPVGLNTAVAEKTYFKNPDDIMFNQSPIYSLSGQNPIAPRLRASNNIWGGQTMAESIAQPNADKTIKSTDFANYNRDNRLDVISYLTAGEAASFGLQRDILNYDLNKFSPTHVTPIPRTSWKTDHLSEITCLKPDGVRYVFNIPAYNITKTEVSYSIDEGDIDLTKHETVHVPNLANFTKHEGGRDDFISITETPPYAYSYLLGAVLSANYIDVDDDGPSVNDIGDYVKFNYGKLPDDYYWRSTNKTYTAMADQGNLADKKDGKAFYSEGTKEVWYVHSIESKNEICWFFYSDRTDAYDLNHFNPEPRYKLKRLDSILIFSRPELSHTDPVPFRRVYFGYKSNATSLCKGVNGDGNLAKLTLNSIYFKNGTSNKGKYSAYTFEYGTEDPTYDPLAVDYWGNYKPNTNLPITLDNKAFPFAVQDSVKAAQYAGAWLLHKINLPSGGEITIDYEAHDYAYVQNKKAMYMTKVVGIENSIPSNGFRGKTLYDFDDNHTMNNFLIFQLKNPIPGSMSQTGADLSVLRDYLTDVNDAEYGHIVNDGSGGTHANLYGKFRVNINTDLGFDDEEIPAFIGGKSCGAIKINNSPDYEYGYVQMEPEDIGLTKNNANPVSKTAWQFVKHAYPQILFDMKEDNSLDVGEGAARIVEMLHPFAHIVKPLLQLGPYLKLRSMGVASTVDLDNSYIRLYVPDGIKFGGNGARVKSVHITDNWENMAGAPASSASYSIHYDYRKQEGSRLISSGVASYEPESNMENPWKQPVFFTEKNGLMPDDNNYLMTPYGESLFPSARIVYSEVRTTQNPVNNLLTQQGTGYTINEYYTNYDFPCSVAQTKIKIRRKSKFRPKPVGNISNDFMLSTQGYLVITNNMHGQIKSEASFGKSGNLVSAKYYKYKQAASDKLDNYVKSIDALGIIRPDQLLGVETQLYGDVRRFHTESYSGSVHGNLDINPVPPAPALSIIPGFAIEKKTFSSFTLNEHIRLQGIVDSIIVVDKGSTVYTKNELWDDKTGAVVLTSTINEFKDPVYNFTYPAHWAYKGMGMASDNISAYSRKKYIANSDLKSVLTDDFIKTLVTGDLIGINAEPEFNAKYVVNPGKNLQLIQTYPVENSPQNRPTSLTHWTAKIILSGKKNLATTSIGSFSSLVNPVTSTNRLNIAYLASSSNKSKIINATAVEYSNKALEKCECLVPETISDIPRDTVLHIPRDTILYIQRDSVLYTPRDPIPYSTTATMRHRMTDTIRYKITDTIRYKITDTIRYKLKDPIFTPTNPTQFKSINDRPLSTQSGPAEVLEYIPDTTNNTNHFFSSLSVSLNGVALKSLAPWQPEASYKYVEDRTQNAGNPVLRRDGFISSFKPFWTTNSFAGTWVKNAIAPWQFTERLSIINSRLKPIESLNPLNIFSSVQHSNFAGMVNATIANARYHETFYESFEDIAQVCDTNHYTISATASLLDEEDAHTGYYSMKTGSSVYSKSFLFDHDIAQGESINVNYVSTNLEPELTLIPHKKYILSAWVKERNATNKTLNYGVANIEVYFSSTEHAICKPSGHIIDGWQRIEQEFTTPANYMDFALKFSPNTNFDDIRIFPADANMKSYVYSYKDYSLMAILDENNFATFYQYDQEKQLKRVLRETEKGIVTIQEVNFGSFKK